MANNILMKHLMVFGFNEEVSRICKSEVVKNFNLFVVSLNRFKCSL